MSKAVDKEIKAWAQDQRDQQDSRLRLDRMPDVVEMLTKMLKATADDDVINWASLARFIHDRIPKAPSHYRAYKAYAEKRLGWTRG